MACCNTDGVTSTAAPAPPRLAVAGFAPGAAAAAVAQPLPACGVGNEAGDRRRQPPPVEAFPPAVAASPGAQDAPSPPSLAAAAPPPPHLRAFPRFPEERRGGGPHSGRAATPLLPAASLPVAAAVGPPCAPVCADAPRTRSRADALQRPPPTIPVAAAGGRVPSSPPPPTPPQPLSPPVTALPPCRWRPSALGPQLGPATAVGRRGAAPSAEPVARWCACRGRRRGAALCCRRHPSAITAPRDAGGAAPRPPFQHLSGRRATR